MLNATSDILHKQTLQYDHSTTYPNSISSNQVHTKSYLKALLNQFEAVFFKRIHLISCQLNVFLEQLDLHFFSFKKAQLHSNAPYKEYWIELAQLQPGMKILCRPHLLTMKWMGAVHPV